MKSYKSNVYATPLNPSLKKPFQFSLDEYNAPPPPPTISTMDTSKTNRNGSISSQPSTPRATTPRSTSTSRSQSRNGRKSATSQSTYLQDTFASSARYTNPNDNQPMRSIQLPTPSFPFTSTDQWLYVFRSDMQQLMDDGKCRELTLNECLEICHKFLQTKKQANEKALQLSTTTLPMETMEQFIYHTYEKKYGLRNLAIEQTGKLVLSLKKYSSQDSTIEVFYKIFKNEIEEDYVNVQNELIHSIHELLMVQLVASNPTKDQTYLNDLLHQKVTNDVIKESEWIDLMNYLYNENDSLEICLTLKKEAQVVFHQGYQEYIQGTNISSLINNTNTGSSSPTREFDSMTMSSPMDSFIRSQLSSTIDDPYVLTKVIQSTPSFQSHEPLALSHLKSNSSSSIPPSPVPNTSIKNITKIQPLVNSSGQIHPSPSIYDTKRLGYSSPSLRSSISSASPMANYQRNNESVVNKANKKKLLKKSMSGSASAANAEVELQLPFARFLRIVLDYQLMNHEKYLSTFKDSFHNLDDNCDGILSIRQFYQCYCTLRGKSTTGGSLSESGNAVQVTESAVNELETFTMLVKLIDPFETDVITFSAAASVLSKMGLQMTRDQ